MQQVARPSGLVESVLDRTQAGWQYFRDLDSDSKRITETGIDGVELLISGGAVWTVATISAPATGGLSLAAAGIVAFGGTLGAVGASLGLLGDFFVDSELNDLIHEQLDIFSIGGIIGSEIEGLLDSDSPWLTKGAALGRAVFSPVDIFLGIRDPDFMSVAGVAGMADTVISDLRYLGGKFPGESRPPQIFSPADYSNSGIPDFTQMNNVFTGDVPDNYGGSASGIFDWHLKWELV